MRLKHIIKEEKDFFTYDNVADDMWKSLLSDSQKQSNIKFDTENNDSLDDGKIIKFGDDNEVACQMWCAGGDWEHPVIYFKCQVKKGILSIGDKYMTEYSNRHFIFIPNKNQGNGHLIKQDDAYVSADAGSKLDESLCDHDKCWSSLEKYLKSLNNKS